MNYYNTSSSINVINISNGNNTLLGGLLAGSLSSTVISYVISIINTKKCTVDEIYHEGQ
jgi:hypothetical protein